MPWATLRVGFAALFPRRGDAHDAERISAASYQLVTGKHNKSTSTLRLEGLRWGFHSDCSRMADTSFECHFMHLMADDALALEQFP
jgi:hypothetical protein